MNSSKSMQNAQKCVSWQHKVRSVLFCEFYFPHTLWILHIPCHLVPMDCHRMYIFHWIHSVLLQLCHFSELNTPIVIIWRLWQTTKSLMWKHWSFLSAAFDTNSFKISVAWLPSREDQGYWNQPKESSISMNSLFKNALTKKNSKNHYENHEERNVNNS